MAQPAIRNTLAWVASAAAVSATAQPPISVSTSLQVLDQIPQRHQQHQSHAVADLGQRDDQPGNLGREV